MASVISEWNDCKRCRLCEGRTNVVVCSPMLDDPAEDDPLLLVIGEAPGAKEDELCQGFVGASGQRLRENVLRAAGARMVFFANVVCCRPPGNRDPEPDEVEACASHLVELAGALQPEAVLAVGRFAGREVMGRSFRKAIGDAATATIRHPAWVARLAKNRQAAEWAKCVSAVRELIGAKSPAGNEKKPVLGDVTDHTHEPVHAGAWVDKHGNEIEELWVCQACGEVVKVP